MRVERVERYLTVFDVWQRIYERRPEIMKQVAVVYEARPHGVKGEQWVEVLPRERIEDVEGERGFWSGGRKGVKAIGAMVEVRPEGGNPRIDHSGAGRWREGESLEMDLKRRRAFVFVDMESEPEYELMWLWARATGDWNEDWYVLESGDSFHGVVNVLRPPREIPEYLGRLIMGMAEGLRVAKREVYGAVGRYLLEHGQEDEKLRGWVEEVRRKFGHREELVSEGKWVFPIDMRHVAYMVEGAIAGGLRVGTLRVGAKHGSVPVLKMQKEGGEITIFESEVDPFNRRQLRLPGM